MKRNSYNKNRFTLNTRLLGLLATVVISFFTNVKESQAQQWGAYTFYSVQNSSAAYLIDTNGTTYHTWTFASTAKTGYSSYLMPGGIVWRTVSNTGNTLTGGGMTGRVQKVDYNGTVLWDFTYSTSSYCLHHDICPLANGNVLLISYDVRTSAEVTAAGCSTTLSSGIWSEKIIEVQPTGSTTGTIVWQWNLWDHLCQNYNSAKNNYVTSIVQHPELMNINYKTTKDWMHMNGIDYNASLDQIVVSSHNMNEFYVIDHSTSTAQAATHTGGNAGKGGDFLYRWGNPVSYGATGTANFNVIHDAHWIPNDCPKAGYLVGFNNKGGTGSKSAIDIINPPLNGYNYTITSGSAYGPSTYAWRHTSTGSTQDMGNSQHLPNGNVLVCIAGSGYIYELDSNQNILWSKTVSGTVPQAFRYTADYVLGTTSVTASATKTSICSGDSTQLKAIPSVSGTYTYSWASNPSGFTSTSQNPYTKPTVNTTYTVTMTSGTSTYTSTVTITVNSNPSKPGITRNNNTLTSSYSSGNQWYNNGTIISGATSQNYTPTADGIYSVKYTDANGCISDMSENFDFVLMGITESDNTSSVSIFPNPTKGILNISVSDASTTEYEINIYNAFGQKVFKSANEQTIDMSEFQNGLYYVEIKLNTSKSVYKKIVLNK